MKHVAIVGGGFAGLAAAVDLAECGVAVTVLEARARLGGRAYSFADRRSGVEIDNGQHAMMGCYTHSLAFLTKIGAAGKLHRQPRLRVEMRHARLGEGRIASGNLPGPFHMASAILGYRLLARRERFQAMVAGARLMRMHRRADSRLSEWTVDALLDRLGQSQNARTSFWYPLAVATLNEAPERAAAAPLAAVLAQAFFGSAADSQFVLPSVGLSRLYTDDARRFIEQRGGHVQTKAVVSQLAIAPDGRVTLDVQAGEPITADACILAVPPAALLPTLPPAWRSYPAFCRLTEIETSPIVSAHLWFDRPVMAADFVGLLGTTTQWVFNRSKLAPDAGLEGGRCVSAVISAGRAIVDWETSRIAQQVLDDLRQLLPATRAAHLEQSVVVKEKHATISPTPAAERLRPSQETPVSTVWLAGDWTRTGLPPVIEGAVASGQRAAACVAARVGAQ